MVDIRPNKDPIDSDISPYRPAQRIDLIDNFNVANKLETSTIDLIDLVTILSGKFVARLYHPTEVLTLYQEFTTHCDLKAIDSLILEKVSATLGSKYSVTKGTFQHLHVNFL